MANFADSSEATLVKFLCLMALFFMRHRINDPSSNFYCRLFGLMRSFPFEGQCCFATLNYDLLLDEAMADFGGFAASHC